MSAGLHSLATIIKRLEAATSRLEDVAMHQHVAANQAQAEPTQDSAKGGSAPPAPMEGKVAEIPSSVVAFDETVVNARVLPWIEMSRQLGGPVHEQAELIGSQFARLRTILLVAASCTKSTDDKAFQDQFLMPLISGNNAVGELKNKPGNNRDWLNHLSTVSEGASCVGWVMEAKPVSFVSEMKDSAQFYSNRVIKEFKDKNQKHVDWARGYISIIDNLKKYVQDWHTAGLTWNAKGTVFPEYAQKLGSAPSASDAAHAPPPPPPPPPVDAQSTSAPSKPVAANPAAVFADLNKGEDVTKRLRKVDKSEMTHKNPGLRAQGSSETVPQKRPARPTKPLSLAGKKPSKLALEGNKWLIEHYENDSSLVITETDLKQVVNIFNCRNSTIQIKGKVNAVSLLNCTKTSILVDSVISSISISASPSFALQITGSCPTLQLDGTDSGQVYLSSKCLDVEIISAKCSAINISLPDPNAGGEEGLFVEKAMPEMMRTIVKSGELVTSILEHKG